MRPVRLHVAQAYHHGGHFLVNRSSKRSGPCQLSLSTPRDGETPCTQPSSRKQAKLPSKQRRARQRGKSKSMETQKEVATKLGQCKNLSRSRTRPRYVQKRAPHNTNTQNTCQEHCQVKKPTENKHIHNRQADPTKIYQPTPQMYITKERRYKGGWQP